MTDRSNSEPSILPSHRLLWGCWAVLMFMTVLTIWASDPAEVRHLPLFSVAVLLGAAGVKAVQILWVFLNLRRSTLSWKATFVAFLLAIIAIVLGGTLLGRLLHH